MKVFTVGLDQKLPLEESKSPPSPPPGYVTPHAASIAVGPESPIIIHQKNRSYKLVLIVLLSIFLFALFALTLSEIAYNRHRDENFFRLRWAELKHRMGWDYDNTQRWPERIYSLHKIPEVSDNRLDVSNSQSIQPINVNNLVTSDSPKAVADANKQSSIADRLQFFKQLLDNIKKHAENMGFDGTMQISVVQVDPVGSANEQSPKSNAFLDGFGEIQQPQRQAVSDKSDADSTENAMKSRRLCGLFKCDEIKEDITNFQISRMGPFRQDWIIPPNMAPKTFDGPFDNSIKQMHIFPKVEMIEIPVEQPEPGSVFGRKFGRLLQEIIANRLRNFQQMSLATPRPEAMQNLQNPVWQPMRPQFPPLFPVDIGAEFNQQQTVRQFQQHTPPPFFFFPNPQPNSFPHNRVDSTPQNIPDQQNVAPEDRIQIEPPAQHFVDWKPWNSDNGNGFINLNELSHQDQVGQISALGKRLPEQPLGNSMPAIGPALPPQPRPVHNGETNGKQELNTAEKPKHDEDEQQKLLPILSIDSPSVKVPEQKPQVEFPGMKFPMNDENDNNRREQNPLFFQVDEPIQQ